MIFILGLLICAWLIFRLTRKSWKPFLRFTGGLLKVSSWITIVLIILVVGFSLACYHEYYMQHREECVAERLLPSDIVVEIKEKGIKKWWERVRWANLEYTFYFGPKEEALVREEEQAKKAVLDKKEAQARDFVKDMEFNYWLCGKKYKY